MHFSKICKGANEDFATLASGVSIMSACSAVEVTVINLKIGRSGKKRRRM